MICDVITDIGAFSALRSEWNELAAASPVDHAFMRHEWFSCWLRHLGPAQDMCFITARESGQLVACAPMLVNTQRIKGIPARVMQFAGSTITPRCNIIAASTAHAEVLFHHLLDYRGVDLLIARGMERDTSPTEALLRVLQNTGRPVEVESARRSPYLVTEGAFDPFLDSLSRSFRTILKRGETKLQKAGDVRFRMINTHAEFQPLLPDLVDISAQSWKAAEHTDLKSLPRVVSFLDEFSRIGERDGLWEAWVLYLNDRPIAFDYYLKGPRSLSLIRTDFDLAHKDLSPGHNLQIAILRDLFSREGAWEYDMGGQAYEYKLRWTSKIRDHVDIWTAGRQKWGRLLMFGKQRLLPLLSSASETPDKTPSDAN